MKDPTDPAFKDDPGMNEWRAFMAKYMPGADLTDANHGFAYGVSMVMWQVLKQCDGDFSRANIMKQAANLHDALRSDPAAGDQGEHQPDQLPSNQGDAVAEVGWQDLGAVRRRDRGGELAPAPLPRVGPPLLPRHGPACPGHLSRHVQAMMLLRHSVARTNPPKAVLAFDQVQFPQPRPMLEWCFPIDRVANIVVLLSINQPGQIVASCET